MTPTELATKDNRPVQPSKSLFRLLGEAAAVLWKDWPRNMECTQADAHIGEPRRYILSGECPYGLHDATFDQVTDLHAEQMVDDNSRVVCAAFKCPRCKKFILGILTETVERIYQDGESYTNYSAVCTDCYPLASPDDSFEEGIPDNIGLSLSEAIRCRSVQAFNAAVEMCGRALEASCLQLGADPALKLGKQIEWVFSQGKIIASLRDMADHIRLARNRGAHPDDAPEASRPLDADDADAVIEFTREYLHDVYVMPHRSSQFDFSRAALKKKPQSP